MSLEAWGDSNDDHEGYVTEDCAEDCAKELFKAGLQAGLQAMHTQSSDFRNWSLSIAALILAVTLAVCAAILTHHSVLLEDQQRHDTSKLEQNSSALLAKAAVQLDKASTLLDKETQQTDNQLRLFQQQQKHLNEAIENVAWITADYKRTTAPRLNALVDNLVNATSHVNDATLPAVDKSVAALTATVNAAQPPLHSLDDAIKTLNVGAQQTFTSADTAFAELTARLKEIAPVIANVDDVTGDIAVMSDETKQVLLSLYHPAKEPARVLIMRYALDHLLPGLGDAVLRWFVTKKLPQTEITLPR